ncbi:MAG TPA: response regulator [Hyphomicrobiaceae bacterium]|jgi:two-component system chemotaxis response regulator CheY|nr:response regulator [Hyphomicrobiaceae bacterium]
MKTCLVVDDSNVVRKVARRILENLKFEISEAESGKDALEQIQQSMPDAIMFDFHMPGMGTVEFLTSLRTMTANGKRPYILYCTTENDTADITRTLTAGADDYVMKPFDRESLRSKLAEAGLL